MHDHAMSCIHGWVCISYHGWVLNSPYPALKGMISIIHRKHVFHFISLFFSFHFLLYLSSHMSLLEISWLIIARLAIRSTWIPRSVTKSKHLSLLLHLLCLTLHKGRFSHFLSRMPIRGSSNQVFIASWLILLPLKVLVFPVNRHIVHQDHLKLEL